MLELRADKRVSPRARRVIGSLLACAALTAGATPATAPSPGLDLLVEGASDYRIVVGGQAATAERFAAEELQAYVERITGVKLPIDSGPARPDDRVVLIGTMAPAEAREALRTLVEDAFLIRTSGPRLILAGATPRATLFAVYAFLENLGVGFPRPGPGAEQPAGRPSLQEETIPRLRSIRLPALERLEKPAFQYRALLAFPMIMEPTRREIDWMAKNRFNWIHLITNTDLSIWQKEKVREVLIPEIRKRGLHLQGIGHSFFAYVPPARYFAEHPEYFALIEGQRRAEHGRGPSLCTSNENVVSLMAENMNAFLEANPEIEVIDLWNNDGLGWCECEACRRLQGLAPDDRGPYRSTTRGYLTFVNQVAARLAARHPGIRVNALAYGLTLHSPPDVQPGPNVLVGIAPWSRVSYAESDDYYVPITQPGPVNDYLRIAIPGWAKQTKQLYIYDYYANRNEFFPIIDTLRKDYAWYQKLGIDEVSSETYIWDEFNLWAYGRLAWNPELPVTQIVEAYCPIAYRAAAQPMQRFHLLLERHKWEWPLHRQELAGFLRQAQEQAATAADQMVQAKLARLGEILARDPQKSWPHSGPPPELGD